MRPGTEDDETSGAQSPNQLEQLQGIDSGGDLGELIGAQGSGVDPSFVGSDPEDSLDDGYASDADGTPQYITDMAPHKWKPRHELIAYMLAHGRSQREISTEVKMTEGRLSILANWPVMKSRVKEIQQGVYEKDVQKRFLSIVPAAIDVAEELMKNKNTKENVRSDIAFRFMDRALGKPKESLEVKSNAITDLFDALDKLGRGAIKEIPKDYIEGEATEVLPSDPIDAWVDKVVPTDTGIGLKKEKETDG